LQAGTGDVRQQLENIADIDIVFSEASKPETIGGIALVGLLRQHCPEINVVLASNDARPDFAGLCGGVHILREPFHSEAMISRPIDVSGTPRHEVKSRYQPAAPFIAAFEHLSGIRRSKKSVDATT